MKTQTIYKSFKEELYFFILKKVKNKNAANDIFQNTFLKIHDQLSTLKNDRKVKSWVFQIARNEIMNHFNRETIYVEQKMAIKEELITGYQEVCCFDKFITELPKIYRETIELAYIQGKKQKEIANILNISLDNVKARIRRAKAVLVKKFNQCCKYQFDKNGQLTGESNCAVCEN